MTISRSTKKRRAPVPRNGGGAPLVWITNRMVARQLKDAGCSIVGILADLARDKTIDPAIRIRAAERITALLFAPRAGDTRAGESGGGSQVDVGGIIARTWAPSGADPSSGARMDSGDDGKFGV